MKMGFCQRESINLISTMCFLPQGVTCRLSRLASEGLLPKSGKGFCWSFLSRREEMSLLYHRGMTGDQLHFSHSNGFMAMLLIKEWKPGAVAGVFNLCSFLQPGLLPHYIRYRPAYSPILGFSHRLATRSRGLMRLRFHLFDKMKWWCILSPGGT